MPVIPFAFSVHHFVNSVGADAGFAAIIGLAILVLLYFAQARETASLRDQSREAAERVQQLELNVAQLSRAQPAPALVASRPAPAPAGFSRPPAAMAVGVAPAMAAVPSAPAGVGAPALTAATRLIPAPERPALTGATAGATDGFPTGVVTERSAAANVGGVIGPPPSTAAGGANGGAPDRLPRAAAAPAGRPAGPPPRRTAPARTRRSGASRGFLIAGGLLGVVAVVAVLLVVTSGGSASHSATTAASTSNAPQRAHRTRAAPFTPSTVTVAVLNGTATANLAHQIALRLGSAGYKQGTIATASDQTETATVVGYLPGHRKDALAVAAALKLGSASVQPVDQSNQAVACPPPAPCTANVIVTVGSDLASTA
jgi:LytR cell envelope-related transcriptional attenuator